MKTNIISFDGGGIKGILSLILLRRLQTQVPSLLEDVDLFAGTSTGGIIALGLAHGLSPLTLQEFYEKKAPAIFDDSWLDDLRDLKGISGAQYSNENLLKALKEVFGDTKLADLTKKVLVPTFELDNEVIGKRRWKAKFFHNYPIFGRDGDQLVVDVAMRTSAAPTYFPTYGKFIDGGVVANNPSMGALTQVLSLGTKLEDVTLLSVGTGSSLKYISGRDHDWGYAQWFEPLVSIMLDGSVDVVDYECKQVLGSQYHRIAPVFPEDITIDMDDIEKIPDLIRIAGKVNLDETVEFLEKNWRNEKNA